MSPTPSFFLASDMSSYVTGAVLPVDGAARSKGPQATTSNLNEAQRKRRAACINRRQRALFCLQGKLRPGISAQNGARFPGTSLRKLYPVLNVDSGIPFPQWPPAETVSHSGAIPGHSFPTAPVSETTSHFEPSDWDVLSGRGSKSGNCIPL